MNAKLFLGGLLVAIPGLLLLTSCGRGTKPAAGDTKTGGVGQVFVTFDGVAVIKDKDYEPALEVLKGREPGLAKMWESLPPQQKRMIVQMIIDQKMMIEVAKKFIAAQGLDKSEEYKKTRAEMLELVDGDLAIKALQKSVSKDIKLDAKEFYATHRLTDGAFQNPAFMITPGGVVLFGVMVPSAADAEKLLAKAKTSGDLRAAAGTFKTQDFGTVTPTSKIDRAILGKALSMAAPGFEQVEAADKKIWVLQAKSKQEPVFKEFDVLPKEVQDEIKQYAEGMGLQEALDKKLKELQATYKVVVNKEAIEKLFPELPEKPAAPVAPVAPIAPVVPAKA